LFAWCLTALSAQINRLYHAIAVGKYITYGQETTQTHDKTMKQYKKKKNIKHSSAWDLWRWSPSHGQASSGELFKTFHSFSKKFKDFFSFLKFKDFQGWPCKSKVDQ